MSNSNDLKYIDKIIKFNLIKSAEKIIEKKSEILELWHIIDEFNLFKKLFLNEDQCFMLKNKDLKLIVEKYNKENLDDKEEEIEEMKLLKLIEYYKNKKLNNKLNDEYDLLFIYLKDEFKQKIIDEINKI